MKHYGNRSDFADLRDEELLRAYLKGAPGENFADAPASRFWVSERRAANVMVRIDRGEEIPSKYPEKVRMYLELYRRLRLLRRRRPELPLIRAMEEIVASPAPSFYMARATAERKVADMIRRRREARLNRPQGGARDRSSRREQEMIVDNLKRKGNERGNCKDS